MYICMYVCRSDDPIFKPSSPHDWQRSDEAGQALRTLRDAVQRPNRGSFSTFGLLG